MSWNFTFSRYTWDAYTYVWWIHICTLSASCEQDCNFVSTRVCILVVFFQVVPNTQCVCWASSNSTWVVSKYSALHTTSILILVYTVSGASVTLCVSSLTPCRVPCSHSVVNIYVAPTWSLARTVYTLYFIHFIPHITTLCVPLSYSSLAQCLLHWCSCIARTVACQSLPRTMSCSSITLYLNPPQCVSAVLSIPTLQWYACKHICILRDSFNSPGLKPCLHTSLYTHSVFLSGLF